MHKMEMLRDRLCDELDELSNVEKISTTSLDAIDKLTHSIKSIDTILAMQQHGYSQGWNLTKVPDYDRYSYGKGRYSNKWDEQDREAEKARLMERIHELS